LPTTGLLRRWFCLDRFPAQQQKHMVRPLWHLWVQYSSTRCLYEGTRSGTLGF